MLVSVAICTWNRARLLDQTLTAMRALRIPAGVAWELLVVNNNCTDDTDEVIAKHSDSLPIRRLFETKQGHSNARNCGMAAAQGELIVWTDDDVLVDENWLNEYVRAARDFPEAGYFGGRIDPWYEVEPAAWLSENADQLQGLLVIRNLGPDNRPFTENELPFGANMALRRSAVAGHGFNPQLGKVRDVCTLADETDYLGRLRDDGWEGIWVPGAVVRHWIPRDRMTRAYLWNYGHGYGRTKVRLESTERRGNGHGAPRWMYRKLATLWLQSTVRRWQGRTDWVRPYLKAAVQRGTIEELREKARAERACQPQLAAAERS